ncbi:GBS Bsp-like repeat-containing protein [Streptococcus gallolyticus]|nr:GBS Bsp-like repeat-containing protein [Streptococcus gallolyticus]MBY5041714.1 GBS Bsp-like repeat-containing protein [Streptococcus gallolyticus]
MSNPQNLRIAVWSDAKGQDDLKWYTAGRKGTSTFIGSFNAQNHKGTGKYHIHLYGTINGSCYNKCSSQ